MSNQYTGSVRLVDRKTRVVEVFGPEPPRSRRPTDRKLLFEPYGPDLPRSVGICFQADGRAAKFLIDQNPLGDHCSTFSASIPRLRLAWRCRTG